MRFRAHLVAIAGERHFLLRALYAIGGHETYTAVAKRCQQLGCIYLDTPWFQHLARVSPSPQRLHDLVGNLERAGPRRIVGAVTEPHAVRRLLAALGLAAEPPPGRPVTAA